MAEPQTSSSITAAFPAPPPFYKHFTETNLARFAELQADSNTDLEDNRNNRSPLNSLLDLPSELRYLQPPPPPPNGRYRSFGEDRSLAAPIIPLPDETSTLYTSPPTPASLIQLTRSILLNFLELVHILATNPSSTEYGPKWDDLRDLFRNAHQAVNEYRPHQAREALILMMEAQVERGRREKEGIEELRTRIDKILEGLGKGLAEREVKESRVNETELRQDSRGGDDEEWDRELEDEERMWEVLKEDLDS
ncbi:Mediator of RNA polymerase II transcription subunit 7 [Xylographa opegraphella]|nr:Mediator of RNA polymerase II transcription subunit 7 [Xylographa opegraphella]